MKTKFIYSLMFANSDKEVSNIIADNFDLLSEDVKLWKFVRNAKRRICRIKREKMKTWKFQLN